MIKAVDNGNTFTKDSDNNLFKSSFSYQDTTLTDNRKIIIDGKTHYFGIGTPNVDVDRTESKINEVCTLACIAMSGTNEYYLVVGLPIAQYKDKKDKLKDAVLNYNGHEIIYQGRIINYKIKDVEVCAQGLGAMYSMNCQEDVILFDIGSYTINIILIEYENGVPKIKKYDTWYNGILTLHTKIMEEINRKYDLTLEPSDAQKILKNGLSVDGEEKDVSFLKPIIADYLEPIFTQFKLNYPYRTVNIALLGGGALLLQDTFERRFKNSFIIPNSQFANALGYYNYGLQKFSKYINSQNIFTRR